MTYLVDTSVWIEAQKPRPRPKGLLLKKLSAEGAALALTPVILQEILQGTRNERDYQRTWAEFEPQRYYLPHDPIHTCAEAAHLYARCRWQGFTPRSSIDCLIARIAIEHDLVLLHDDADFEKIAAIEPRLRLV